MVCFFYFDENYAIALLLSVSDPIPLPMRRSFRSGSGRVEPAAVEDAVLMPHDSNPTVLLHRGLLHQHQPLPLVFCSARCHTGYKEENNPPSRHCCVFSNVELHTHPFYLRCTMRLHHHHQPRPPFESETSATTQPCSCRKR